MSDPPRCLLCGVPLPSAHARAVVALDAHRVLVALCDPPCGAIKERLAALGAKGQGQQ